ncbi:MAG: universal stress protein [Nitrospirales bacterium]|jgi:nucleotide-binding universal stress UspA family protein|nr:MAG: universal stress protein [Nitrospirales bacterium]
MKYLLAVDGSDQSLDATRAFEALSPAESLKVLHVVSVPGIPYPAMGANVAKDLATTVELAMKEEGERALDQAVSLLPLHPGSVSKQLEMGSPAESILKVAQEEKVDLVVMGARGLGRIQEQIFGSVSHRVMTHVPCSTLLVKQPIRSIKNLLVPIDSQEDADAVLSFFKKKPFREPCTITVLHVIPMVQPVWPVGAMIPPAFRKEMFSYAEKFTQVLCLELERLGHQAKGVAIEGAPSFTIVEEVKKIKPDLLVMRPQSHSAVGRFFLGSVSHSIVHNTDCSLLLVRE